MPRQASTLRYERLSDSPSTIGLVQLKGVYSASQLPCHQLAHSITVPAGEFDWGLSPPMGAEAKAIPRLGSPGLYKSCCSPASSSIDIQNNLKDIPTRRFVVLRTKVFRISLHAIGIFFFIPIARLVGIRIYFAFVPMPL